MRKAKSLLQNILFILKKLLIVSLILFHSERPKLHKFLSAAGLIHIYSISDQFHKPMLDYKISSEANN